MKNWLVWSNEHGAWWAPNHRGYTRLRSEAGRYTEDHARNICAGANHSIPDNKPPNETMVRDSDLT